MFIQVIRGHVKDADALRARFEFWDKEMKPGAKGFLGATGGVAADGTYVNVVRFESEQAARANSGRPEQGSWWADTEKLFDGPVAFFDCPQVDLFQGGGSDTAGFVQVMIYKPKDIDAIRAMSKEFEKLASLRPDVIGGSTAFATDGTIIDTNYFTSEAEARAGEKQGLPADMAPVMERFQRLAGQIEFIDLGNPWYMSA